MEIKIENLFVIGYGLAGGFGGQHNFIVVEAKNLEDAENQAYEMCCEHYEEYSGTNGLRDIGEIMEEEGIDNEDEALEVFNDERESWLDYSAVPYSKEYEEKVSGYHYQNDFKSITDK